jgi:hypothetical protein
MPAVFRCPDRSTGDETSTSYLAFTGPGTVFPDPRPPSKTVPPPVAGPEGPKGAGPAPTPEGKGTIVEKPPGGPVLQVPTTEPGVSDPIIVAEVADSGIAWTEPRDLDTLTMSPIVNSNPKEGISSKHPSGAFALRERGSVEFEPENKQASIEGETLIMSHQGGPPEPKAEQGQVGDEGQAESASSRCGAGAVQGPIAGRKPSRPLYAGQVRSETRGNAWKHCLWIGASRDDLDRIDLVTYEHPQFQRAEVRLIGSPPGKVPVRLIDEGPGRSIKGNLKHSSDKLTFFRAYYYGTGYLSGSVKVTLYSRGGDVLDRFEAPMPRAYANYARESNIDKYLNEDGSVRD